MGLRNSPKKSGRLSGMICFGTGNMNSDDKKYDCTKTHKFCMCTRVKKFLYSNYTKEVT